jgi:hypothetical protein
VRARVLASSDTNPHKALLISVARQYIMAA